MPGSGSPSRPSPLVVAAALAGVEGVLVLAFAVVEAASVHAGRVTMALTTAVFFGLVGVLLAACAWFVWDGRAWARSPIVVAQLLGLGLAWGFWGGSTRWLSILLAVVAAVVLLGLLHPASIDALSGRADDREG